MSLPAPQEDRRSGLLVAVRRRFRQGLVWAVREDGPSC